MGNGRATVIRFAQEGARVLAVDRDLASAQETCAMAAKDGKGACEAFAADVTREASMQRHDRARAAKRGAASTSCITMSACRWPAATPPPDAITEEAFDRVVTINLRGMVMACKHVLPLMRAQKSGVILGISSIAAIENYPYVTYKATKAAMVAYVQQLAIHEAGNGIRANVILPGLMDTPMAVDTRARHSGKTRAEVAAMRDSHVPLRQKMGTAWDVANAALFLASDEANFITGVALPVDGGALVKIG